MKVIVFDGTMDTKEPNFKQFIENLVDLSPEKEEEVRVYFSSEGGNCDAMFILLDVFEKLPYKNNITLVPMYLIASNAFTFFVKAKCKKEFVCGTVAVIHLTQAVVSTRSISGKFNYDSIQKRNVEIENKEQLVELKSWGLTKSELNVVKTGNDLSVDVNRLKEICKIAEGLNVNSR